MLHPQETLSSEEYKGAPASSPKGKTGVEKSDRRGYKVWIDLENSPHVPFFLPIIREMEARGCTVVLTARDCFQVCELADLAGLKYSKVGRHYGKNPFAKLFGLGVRILRLAPLVLGERPKISVSHNSRSSIILSGLLGNSESEHYRLRIRRSAHYRLVRFKAKEMGSHSGVDSYGEF